MDLSQFEDLANFVPLQNSNQPEDVGESLVFVTERVLGTLATLLASQVGSSSLSSQDWEKILHHSDNHQTESRIKRVPRELTAIADTPS